MLRVLILCTVIHSAISMSINRSYNRKLEKDLQKEPFYHQSRFPDRSFENEKSRYYDSNYDEPPFPGNTRRTRVLKWLKKILINTAEPRYFSFEDSRERFEEANMTAVLIKLVRALDSLNKNLKCNNKNDYSSFRLPTRLKRDLNNGHTHNSSELDNTHNKNNSLKSGITLEHSDTRSSDTFKTKTANSDSTEFLANKKDDTSDFSNSRRFIFTPKPMPKLKERLLEYLENMFIDLELKIRPLTKLKMTLSENNGYRIGYVIANIDTLQIQLQKLKREMDKNKYFWSENKVNELFNKLKGASDVVSNLLDILISYLPSRVVMAEY